MVAVIFNRKTGDRIFKSNASQSYVYNWMMFITDGDHEISSEAASWCMTAKCGDEYEFREGRITIQ